MMPFERESARKPSCGGRLKSTSEEDAHLDTELLLKCLEEDSDKLFSLRINNVPVEKETLTAIFEAVKTTTNMKHLSLAGIGLKDEIGLEFVEAFKSNKSLESLNLESNDLTNNALEPLFEILETHPNMREFKCSHQKAGLGSRGEEAMARALDKNEKLLKISYPFKVPSARSLADRCQIRNNEILRKKRTNGEEFYNYKEEMMKRDNTPQPWIKEQVEDKNEKMVADISVRKTSMTKVQGNAASRRADAIARAKENAKPTMDNELANALGKARKASRGGAR